MSTEPFLVVSDAVIINIFKGDKSWKKVMRLQDKESKTFTKWRPACKKNWRWENFKMMHQQTNRPNWNLFNYKW